MQVDGPVGAMLEATNNEDSAAFLDAFAADGVIEDWGRVFTGRADLARWNDNENIGVHSRIEATSVQQEGDRTTIGVQVTGNGYNGGGSFVFTIRDGLIHRLVIAG